MKKENIGRIFECILYLDNLPQYLDQVMKLENLCIDNHYSYYYITHDKDKNTKNHTHFLIYTNGSTTTLNHISKEVGIKKNLIEKKNYLTSSIKYLTHESTNSGDKALYDWHNITSNDIARINKVYENLDENTYMREFINYIDETSSIIEYRQFVEFVLSKNLWSYYRRSASILRLLIEEHNNKIKAKW